MVPNVNTDMYLRVRDEYSYAAWSTARPGQWLVASRVDGVWQIVDSMNAELITRVYASYIFWGMKVVDSDIVLVMGRKSQYGSRYTQGMTVEDAGVSSVRV